MTGVDDPFEEPLNPDLVVDTSTDTPAVSTDRILRYLTEEGVLRPPVAR